MIKSRASVIIPVWNGIEYLADCLEALLAQDYPDFEVITVDNASTDGSADFIAENYPQVRLMRNERNLGFAGGCNVGIRMAEGDALVLLNQDTEVHSGWLNALVKTVSSDDTIGIVGGKCLYPDGTLQHAGGYLDAQGGGHHYGYREANSDQFERRREVTFVTGANLAISRSALDVVGELDEQFSPAYYEDVDLCLRARNAGLRVLYEPQAIVTHKEASMLAGEGREKMYLFHNNRLHLVLKHWPLTQLVDEFLPAERGWLQGLAAGGERLIAVMHSIYLASLLNLGVVVASRIEKTDPVATQTEMLVKVLLDLSGVVPLQLAKMAAPVACAGECDNDSREKILSWLHQGWAIEARPFCSKVPVIGSLIAAFRHCWNRISTEWYIRPLLQQQIEFNAHLVELVAYLDHDLASVHEHQQRLSESQQRLSESQQRLLEVLEEYLSEYGREIAQLADNFRKLKSQ